MTRPGDFVRATSAREMGRGILALAAARFVIGNATGKDLVRAAQEALLAGSESPTLTVLAAETDPIMSDAAPLFQSALRELSVEIPSKTTACWVVLRQHMASIVTQAVTPAAGVRALLDDVYYPCLHDQSVEYAGDSHGLQEILGAFHGIADIEDRPDEVSIDGKFGVQAIAAVEQHILELADAWLKVHGTIVRASSSET